MSLTAITNSGNLKILHIIDSSGIYGAEVMLLNLIEEQIKLGIQPVIASIGEKKISEKPLETEAIKRGFLVKKFRMIPGPNPVGAYGVLKYAHKHNFDLLHSHGYKGNILFGFIPKKIRKLPLLSTLHGHTSTSGLTKMRVYEWFDLCSHRFIDQMVLVNKGMLTSPRLKNRKGINFQVINNGIPISSHPNTFSASNKQDFPIINFCQKSFTIGTIGRLSKEKGYDYLIKALFILRQKGIDARLVIIGEGGQRDYLEELIKENNLLNHVVMSGYKEKASLYIPFFDVYVISSLTEGLPITLLEAMQAHVPVVATKVGGIPNILKNNESGILIDPCNPDAISQAVMALHGNKKMSDKLARSAYKMVLAGFSSKKMAMEYLNVYRNIMDPAGFVDFSRKNSFFRKLKSQRENKK